jgi:hypothetical protein
MIQLTRSGLARHRAADIETLRAQFAAQQCVHLPRFLDPDLLVGLQEQVDHARFDDRVHRDIGRELCMTSNATLSFLYFLANDPEVFRMVQQITGCGPLGCFTGRVYRMSPGPGHYDSWHSDALEHRVIGMSVNLGRGIYTGGIFQLRDLRSQKMLTEVANTGPGDAILFQISSDLAHRVTPVDGTTDKTAFAGWFRSEPAFLSLLKVGQDAI